METKTKDNRYTFTHDIYTCECIFGKSDTYLKFKDQQILLIFDALGEFKYNDYPPMQVGFKVTETGGIKEPVDAQKVGGLIELGCVQLTEEQFNKFYNLIKFKQNEFYRINKSSNI